MYVVARKNGTWEARESSRTADGPRSRTLAGFRKLDRETIDLIRDRASGTVDEEELRQIAARAGAPVEPAPADRAGSALLRSLARGVRPRAAISNLVAESLGAGGEPTSDAAKSMAGWIGASQRERSDALIDLLLLADHLPAGSRPGSTPGFPRIRSA
ncbi:MAG: hypothetical protein ACERKT_06340 [Acidobacteriota bacterium]